MKHKFSEYKCKCGVKYCNECNDKCLLCNNEKKSKFISRKDMTRGSLTEQETYIRYEWRLKRFYFWLVFGKKEAIEQGVSDRVFIAFFYRTKKRKYYKGFTLLK